MRDETAGQLGLPPETVKTRLFRPAKLLLRALREKLASRVSEAFSFLGLGPSASACLRRVKILEERGGIRG